MGTGQLTDAILAAPRRPPAPTTAPCSVGSLDGPGDPAIPYAVLFVPNLAFCCRLVEIRAAQRTFEGAYTRTALSQFSFALIILKIFTSEFYAIGALFAIYGATVVLCALYRRYEGNRQFFSTIDNEGKVMSKFRTCNNSVLLLTVLSLGAYIGLLILTWDLAN
ncbi:hypothetical protein CIB48_g1131 [Xylaria polymorpha]|nr:hypothetical protein CIB48_g1131 [Xylaria polymorpha]